MNNRGFIKIKLLSIILVVCIVCFIGIPKLVTYIDNIKKDRYIDVVLAYINEVKENIGTLEYKQMPKANEALAVPISNLSLKKSSPYGMFKNDYTYVIVVNCENYYDYYFAGIDTSKHGIPIIGEKELNRESIVYGDSNLSGINKVTSIKNLFIKGTIYKKSDDSREDDSNILLSPVSGDLTVPYEYKEEVYSVYNDLIKNIDVEVYNKEATLNHGILKYNSQIIRDSYSTDMNGLFRYLSFPDGDALKYYASFVVYNNSYVAATINASDDYSSKNMIFDSIPTVVINKDASIVTASDKSYLMWNLMAIYPSNNNYTISECGAILMKDNNATSVYLDLDTPNIMVGKSQNNCELGNIFAIRKTDVKTNDRWFARGYIKYKDKVGNEYISYSHDVISALVK